MFISVVNNDKWNESDIYFNNEVSLDDTYGNIKGVSNLKIIRKMLNKSYLLFVFFFTKMSTFYAFKRQILVNKLS